MHIIACNSNGHMQGEDVYGTAYLEWVSGHVGRVFVDTSSVIYLTGVN
jgi:hypothetical protein